MPEIGLFDNGTRIGRKRASLRSKAQTMIIARRTHCQPSASRADDMPGGLLGHINNREDNHDYLAQE